MTVQTDRLTPDQDRFYAALMAAHDGLDDAQSQALNARLVLLLANRIGDVTELEALIDTARSYTPTP